MHPIPNLTLWIFVPLVALIAGAESAEVARTANSGEPTLIRRYFAWNPDCTFGSINVTVTTKPKHGNVEPKFGDFVLTPETVRGGSLGKCEGKSIRAVELHYTSTGGFRGKDGFAVHVKSSDGKLVVTDVYTVDVK